MHVDVRLFSPKLVPEKNVVFSFELCNTQPPLPSLPKKNPIGDGEEWNLVTCQDSFIKSNVKRGSSELFWSLIDPQSLETELSV